MSTVMVTTCDVNDHELCHIRVYFSSGCSTLNLSMYHVTDISVKSLTYHDDDLLTVAVIAAVDREPMVGSLKSSLTARLKRLSLDVVNALEDVEVTGYLPSRKLLCTGSVLLCFNVYFTCL